ncbi:D-alanyl-D-alanine carboxypeptidase/D-alanyl-D-alanine-endopeptidase [soil metagenome]
MSTSTTLRALGLALFFALAPLPSPAQAPAGEPLPPLQLQAEQILAKVQGRWSVLAWSVDRDQPLFAINPDSILVPASNNKVFTAVWVLEVLGPEYRFPTDLLITAPIEGDGVLRGDVVLRGSGDPAFGYPEFTRDPMQPLRVMARRLRERGVRVVEGAVVGDGSAFDSLLVGPGWPRDTEGGASEYAPRVSGLAFQRNVLWIDLQPTQPGQPALVHRRPAVEEIPVISMVRTGGGSALAVRRPQDDTIRVQGAVAGRGLHRYRVGVTEPALLAAGALRQALIEEGIEVRGGARTGTTPEGAKHIHRHYSIPLAMMIPKLNQDSDNFFAEHLFKAAVRRATGLGSYHRGGSASAIFFHRTAEVPLGEVYQADGSGLSSYNRASAHALVQALLHAHAAPWSESFHQSLAMAGSRYGTLRRQFVGTAAAGNLHAKTGYVRGSRTLSGFVRTRDGQLVAFSFLYNGGNTNGARAAQMELGTLLAEYPQEALAGRQTTAR